MSRGDDHSITFQRCPEEVNFIPFYDIFFDIISHKSSSNKRSIPQGSLQFLYFFLEFRMDVLKPQQGESERKFSNFQSYFINYGHVTYFTKSISVLLFSIVVHQIRERNSRNLFYLFIYLFISLSLYFFISFFLSFFLSLFVFFHLLSLIFYLFWKIS